MTIAPPDILAHKAALSAANKDGASQGVPVGAEA